MMTGMTRRRVLVGAAGAVISSGLALPAWAEEGQRGGTLVIGYTQVPRHLNSAVQSGTATGLPSTQLFASPLRYDDNWEPQPYLAESWDFAEDGRSLTLNLRKNAVFHDGEPITSADVAFSVMAIKANHPFGSMLEPVEAVDTPDAHTAIIRTSRPHPALLLVMSPALCPIMPKHIYGDGQDLMSHPRNSQDVVGSGPFKWVEFTPNQRVVMERFDDYFIPGRPYLDRLIVDINPDVSTVVLNFEQGNTQLLPFLSTPVNLKRLEGNKNVRLLSRGYEGVGPTDVFTFNLAKEPFSDVNVRHAIAMAIDKNFVTKALMGGFATALNGPIVPTSPFYAEASVKTYPFDLKKAAQLLDDSGYEKKSNGKRFSMTIDYIPGLGIRGSGMAEYIRGQLRKLDIDAQIRSAPDFPTWSKRMAEHDYDTSMDVLFNWGDPTIGVSRSYMSDNIKPAVWTNTTSYENKKVDELLNAAAQEMDLEKRKAMYADFQEIVTTDLPMNYMYVIPYHTAVSDKVGNPPESIWGPMSPFDEVYLKS